MVLGESQILGTKEPPGASDHNTRVVLAMLITNQAPIEAVNIPIGTLQMLNPRLMLALRPIIGAYDSPCLSGKLVPNHPSGKP
jgi:hypothetical protein